MLRNKIEIFFVLKGCIHMKSSLTINLMKLVKQVDPTNEQVIVNAYVDTETGCLVMELEDVIAENESSDE
jgi:hypothetical protein